jgi:phospholipid/cholesterol/gamma-HCH transport system substrate-binding protein
MTGRLVARGGIAIALAGVLIAGVVQLVASTVDAGRIHVAAYFSNSNGIFVGDVVSILGVPVGKIESIEPQPEFVKIGFWYESRYTVPASARAVILSPSLVTARVIQLTPAYSSGPVMKDGSTIPQERTAVPLEWDDLRQQLEKLVAMMKPTEPGGTSPLGAAVTTAADNLRGQGATIRDSIIKLATAVTAISDHSDDLFGSVKNVAVLVSALETSGELMRQLNANLASVTDVLSNEPNEIGRAVVALRGVASEVQSFVADNRDTLGTTSDKLAAVSTAVNASLDDIKQTLHIAPNELQNFMNIYQPAQGTLSGAQAFNNFANPLMFLCGAIQAASRLGAEESAKRCVQYLAPIVKNRQYNFPPLGENLVVGAAARPNEVTYSEPWMRPDYVPPPNDSAVNADVPPLPAESNAEPVERQTTNSDQGLTGIMVPTGAGP